MKILVACEESQTVTNSFRELGHEAYSCDILPCSGGHPEYHLQTDVLPILKESWDMIIAFPMCTHLATSGARWFEEKRKDGRQQQGIDFFMQFVNAKCNKVAIENPVGIMSTLYRKPDQIVQPWMFGDPFTKTTCLWLKNLRLLVPTNVVDKGKIVIHGGKRIPEWYSNAKHSERNKIRSKTFEGIAKCMANTCKLDIVLIYSIGIIYIRINEAGVGGTLTKILAQYVSSTPATEQRMHISECLDITPSRRAGQGDGRAGQGDGQGDARTGHLVLKIGF